MRSEIQHLSQYHDSFIFLNLFTSYNHGIIIAHLLPNKYTR